MFLNISMLYTQLKICTYIMTIVEKLWTKYFGETQNKSLCLVKSILYFIIDMPAFLVKIKTFSWHINQYITYYFNALKDG